jgi:rRNA maturation RNase YbeY
MNINFYNKDASYIVTKRKIRAWLSMVLEQEQKKTGEISFIFCSDEYLLTLNKQYLNASYLTDVITFDYCEDDFISGDIFISVDRVKENAKLYQQTTSKEMHRVILHGVLHLCGYKDKTEKEIQQMRGKEEYYLQQFTAIN